MMVISAVEKQPKTRTNYGTINIPKFIYTKYYKDEYIRAFNYNALLK